MRLFDRLQTRLNITFFLLTMVPLLIVGGLVTQRSTDLIRQDAEAYLLERSKRIAAEIDAFLTARTNTLLYVARVTDFSQDGQTALINGILAFDTAFQELTVLDASGREIERISRTEVILPNDYGDRSNRPEYTAIVADKPIYYSDIYFDDALRETLMTISVPIIDPTTGRLDRVLVADFRFDVIDDLLDGLDYRTGETAYLLSTDGTVIAHHDLPPVSGTTQRDVPNATSGLMTEAHSNEVLFAAERLQFGTREITIVVEQKTSQAFSLVRDVQVITGSVLIVSLLGVAALSMVVVLHAVRPIKRLSNVTQQIAQGDLSQRITLLGHGEFAMLADSFNKMADRISDLVRDLEDQVTALKTSEEKYRHLTENASDIIYRLQLKPEVCLTYISPAVTEIIGYTPEAHYADPELIYKQIHPDDRHFIQNPAAHMTEEPIVLRWIHKDGSIIWTEQKNRPVYDASGELIAIEGIARDITARRRAQVAVQESERKYRMLFENMTTGFALHEMLFDARGNPTDYRFLEVNPAFEKLTGLSADVLIGRTVKEVLPDTERYWIDTYGQVVLTGEHISYQNFSAELDKYFDVWAFRASPNHFAVIFVDITEREKSEQLLQTRLRLSAYAHTHSLYELLQKTLDETEQLTGSQIGFFHFIEDDQTTVQLQVWSSNTRNMCTADIEHTHYPVNEAGVWVDCIHQRRPVIHNNYADLVQRSEMPEGHVKIVRELTVPVMQNETIMAVLGIGNKPTNYDDSDIQLVRELANMAWDIVMRKRAEEVLQEQQALYRTLVNVAPIGISVVQDSRHVFVNPTTAKMLGFENPDDLVGIPMIDIISAEHVALVEESLASVAAGRSISSVELKLRTHDGKSIWTESLSTPIVYQGEPAALIIGLDITARKRNEKIELEHERLKANFQQEQERNAFIQRIISALSHDLRTPLAVILSSKDMLDRYYDRMPPEKRRERLDTIGHQINFAMQLLDDTVQMARNNLHAHELHLEPVNLATLCSVSIEEIRTAYNAPHQIHFINLTSVETVNVDVTLVSRILMNLLSNAIKYSAESSEIKLELDSHGDLVMLRVIDQGQGIDENTLQHIFEPFYRAYGVQHIQGTGLGLSIVKDCVDRHNGRVQVKSELGLGTTITVELPFNRHVIEQ